MEAERTVIEAESDKPDLQELILETEGVDDSIEEMLAKAYMNDRAGVLEVTDIEHQAEDGEIVVTMETLYGDGGCQRRFDCPDRPSLQESKELVEFLEATGVSPMEIGELIGERIPATYSEVKGWKVDDSRLLSDSDERNVSDVSNASTVSDESDSPDGVSLPEINPYDRVLSWFRNAENEVILALTLLVAKILVIAVILTFIA